MKTAIVTLSDAGYFHLLEELVDSIQSFTESSSVSICVLDAGMTDEQLNKIKKKVLFSRKSKLGHSSSNLKN